MIFVLYEKNKYAVYIRLVKTNSPYSHKNFIEITDNKSYNGKSDY